LRLRRFTVGVRSLRRSVPVVVLIIGFALLGAGFAGVARVDAPLEAAAQRERVPPAGYDVDVDWHHRRGDCPNRDASPTART
jgi:hypothetical protein